MVRAHVNLYTAVRPYCSANMSLNVHFPTYDQNRLAGLVGQAERV